MIQQIRPGLRTGEVLAPPSKSIAHRALISAALSEKPSVILCREISRDIQATMDCLRGLGADITYDGTWIRVDPAGIHQPWQGAEPILLPCGESGSTLRFLIPVAGALGKQVVFHMEGRLPQRPMDLYEEVLISHGMRIRREGNFLYCEGKLEPGEYAMPGNISSQYFSGLLFSLPLLDTDSFLRTKGQLESADYVRLTEKELQNAGIQWFVQEDGYRIPGGQRYHAPEETVIEGDYSNAAFFLCMGAFSPEGIIVRGLQKESLQGDRRITDVLRSFGASVLLEETQVMVRKNELRGIAIDASMIPDLIPVLSVVAAGCSGETRIYNGERLRMKESDRIQSTASMLTALGADVKETQDGMILKGKESLAGGAEVDSCNDHRIAMAAATAACICRNPVTIQDASCVQKSFPDFWKVFGSLPICGTDSM